jgi:hypothetical protein
MDRSIRTRSRPGRASKGASRALPLAVLTVAMVLPSSHAWALPAETPDNTWQLNGPARAIVKVGGTIFIGGDFTELRENPVGQGGQVIEVDNFAALDAASGTPVPRMFVDPPNFTGDADVVLSLLAAGGKLWVGGKFGAVDGATRRNLAALDLSTLALDPFAPRVSGSVYALASDGTKVYAGGKFPTVNGQPRGRLAAFSLSGNLSSTWTPSANDRVYDMAVTPDGSALFVTGDFKSVADSSGSSRERNSLASIDTQTGDIDAWVPSPPPPSLKIRGTGVTIESGRVYWGVGGSDWVAAYRLDSGTRIFKTETDGTVHEVVEMGDRVIIGGHFLLVGPAPGGRGCATFPEDCVSHKRIAALTMSGVLDQTWDARLQGEWQGAKRFLVDGDNLWVAGAFTRITGVPQTYLGRLS